MAKRTVKDIREECGQCYHEHISHKRLKNGAVVKRRRDQVNFLCVPQDKDTTHIKDCKNANCPKLKGKG